MSVSMGFFKKKSDPITERAQQLEREIAALEAHIQSLNHKLPTHHAQPASSELNVSLTSFGSKSLSSSPIAQTPTTSKQPAPGSSANIPANSAGAFPAEPLVFENVKLQKPKQPSTTDQPEKFNELGVRKLDLVALWQWVMRFFSGPDAHNPRLVSYLASGTVQGLRPLRYERRIARNRFWGLAILLSLILWGITYAFIRNR